MTGLFWVMTDIETANDELSKALKVFNEAQDLREKIFEKLFEAAELMDEQSEKMREAVAIATDTVPMYPNMAYRVLLAGALETIRKTMESERSTRVDLKKLKERYKRLIDDVE